MAVAPMTPRFRLAEKFEPVRPGCYHGANGETQFHRTARLRAARLASSAKTRYFASMSTILEIESAVQKLPLEQARALRDWLADYLGESKAAAWQRLARETRSLPSVQSISDQDIAAEIAAYRAGK
jgi:hypothetical protein